MKNALLVLLTVLTAAGAAAQDTIRANRPFDNYLYNEWNNFKEGDTMDCKRSSNYPYTAYCGQVMYNPDTLPIYGVAIGIDLKPASDQMGVVNGEMVIIPGDTALDHTYMDIVILQVANGSVYAASDTMRLHLKYEPISYYLDNGFYGFGNHPFYYPCPVIPVYELYFDSAVTVFDKFYLGGRNYSDTCHGAYYPYPHIFVAGWARWNHTTRYYVINWDDRGAWEEHLNITWEWFFPILTPNPDTNNYVPDDSTQTDVQLAAWERYVALQPNPATDKATVLSSVGLKEVEVFDLSGNRVLVQGASGLSAKLDVGTLPRGTYIVRIHTPLGVTSRKLLLQ